MKTVLTFSLIVAISYGTFAAEEKLMPNRMIDYNRFLQNAIAVRQLREQHRVSEEQFIRMTAAPGTIIFDARSDAKFDMLHVKNARHLSLPDVTADELAKIIPDKSTRILIYCNNNFANESVAMPGKAVSASLNLYTFNTLYSYGYKNVYELGPYIDIKRSSLTFEGSLVQK
jgi:rhodanese-related sulfurtransferase